MNRPALALSAALAVSIALAAMYARDLQRERARADALAMRLSEHEPLEKGGSPMRLRTESAVMHDARTEPTVETPVAPPTLTDTSNPVKRIMEYRGTQRTRQLVALIGLLEADRDAEKAK